MWLLFFFFCYFYCYCYCCVATRMHSNAGNYPSRSTSSYSSMRPTIVHPCIHTYILHIHTHTHIYLWCHVACPLAILSLSLTIALWKFEPLHQVQNQQHMEMFLASPPLLHSLTPRCVRWSTRERAMK